MKNRILDHWGMKILSLTIAIIIWIIVANVDDYKTTKQITGIEIEFINGNAITEKNKVYEVPEGTTIDVVVKGRRKLVEGLNNSDFKAVADLSKMSVTNAVTVEVSAVNSVVARDVTISYTNNAVVIAVEDKIEKQLPITVRVNSQVADGMAIRNKTATPNLITVKGAESVVNTIASVVLDVDVSGATHSLSLQGSPVFVDGNGNEIDSSKFEYDVDQVEAFVEILPTKELTVRMKTSGEPREGYAIASLDYQPTTIQVVGDGSDLAKVEEIVIDDIDVEDLYKDTETSVNILDYLPEGITLADDNSEIMIKIIMEKIEEKTLIIENDDINIVGKKTGYSYSFTAADKHTLKVQGLEEKLKSLKIANLIPSIDVSGYEPGVYIFTVNLKELEGIKISQEITVELEIAQMEE
ncbi:MAG: CdaR family protein [Clostridiales bacterium]|nr:CdaR family protein [Clostridiales bacterium]